MQTNPPRPPGTWAWPTPPSLWTGHTFNGEKKEGECVWGGEQERRRICKKSQYIYGLLYKSYYNTMVHSIEFTKIWTNIYSKTHPQRKHFSSKTSYIRMTESIRTDNPKIDWFSSLQGQGGGGGGKKKKTKIRNPWPFKSRDLFNDKKSFQRKMGPHIRIIANRSWGVSQGFGGGRQPQRLTHHQGQRARIPWWGSMRHRQGPGNSSLASGRPHPYPFVVDGSR